MNKMKIYKPVGKCKSFLMVEIQGGRRKTRVYTR